MVMTHMMERILKGNNFKWGVTLHMVKEISTSSIKEGKPFLYKVQSILDKHSIIIGDMPKGLPPKRIFEHMFKLEDRSKPIMITLYRYPHAHKMNIKKIIKEILGIAFIHLISSRRIKY